MYAIISISGLNKQPTAPSDETTTIDGFTWDVVVAQAVAHQTTDRKVASSIPAAAGSWAFSLVYLYLSLSLSLLFPIILSVVRPYSGPSWRCNTTGFQLSKKIKFLAMPSSGEQVEVQGMGVKKILLMRLEECFPK